MAGKNEIKQKIVLEGEKEYSARIKEAGRNLKTLQSQLKAETAELGKNATAQQKNELRTKNLQQQIAEQEKVVKTLREALKQAKEQYADNEDVIARWEQKLNSARTTLANMKNGLADAGNGFKAIAGDANTAVIAANSVADAFDKLAKVGDTISGSLEHAFTGAVSAVRDAVTAVWGEIADLAAKSNNTVDLAGYWNTSATTIQKYAGAVAYASGNLEDLNGLVTKINSADPKKIAELTGVSAEGYEDMWEYAMAVMDAMSLMDTQTRNRAGFEIFGKGATKMFDLANDWQTVKDNLWRFDAESGGLGLSEDSLQKMSDLYDKINGIKASWEALKGMALVNLTGDLSINLSGNVQAILDALKKYLDADSDEEREAAIKEIEDNIIAMFEAVKKAIEEGLAKMDELAAELQASDNPAVKAVGDIMAGIVKALEWLTEDNMKNAIGALELLVAFWAGSKVLTMVATVGKFAASLTTLKTWKASKDLTNFLNGGNPSATPTTTPTVDPTKDPKTQSFTNKMIDKVGPAGLTAAAKVGGVLANVAGMGIMGGTMLMDKTSWGQALMNGQGIQGAIDAVKTDLDRTFSDENKQAFQENWDPHSKNANVIAKGLGAGIDWVKGIPEAVNNGVVQPVAGFVEGQVENALRFWAENTDNTARFWGGVWNDSVNWVTKLGKDVSDGLARMFENPEDRRKRNAELDEAGMREEPTGGPAIIAEIQTEEEWVELEDEMNEVQKTGYSLAEKITAIENWWDEYMAWQNGTGDEEKEGELFADMQEVLGDEFGDVWDEVIRTLDEMGDHAWEMTDIPPSWWQNLNTDGITQGDVAGLNNTLGTLGRMVFEGASGGVSKGISGLRVDLDGQAVGRLVAPYVSRQIAYTIM